MKNKVTGVGGIFFKCKNPKEIKKWYAKNLGFQTDKYGAMFKFKTEENNSDSYLQWSTFEESTDYFSPSEKGFMINYRVNDLVGLVKQLKSNGVTVLDEIETFDYGKFVHILDPENNKIELWEPIDQAFTDYYKTKNED